MSHQFIIVVRGIIGLATALRSADRALPLLS